MRDARVNRSSAILAKAKRQSLWMGIGSLGAVCLATVTNLIPFWPDTSWELVILGLVFSAVFFLVYVISATLLKFGRDSHSHADRAGPLPAAAQSTGRSEDQRTPSADRGSAILVKTRRESFWMGLCFLGFSCLATATNLMPVLPNAGWEAVVLGLISSAACFSVYAISVALLKFRRD